MRHGLALLRAGLDRADRLHGEVGAVPGPPRRRGPSAEAVERITTPIGLPGISGKDPATIAVSIAAALVHTFERDRADAGHRGPARP